MSGLGAFIEGAFQGFEYGQQNKDRQRRRDREDDLWERDAERFGWEREDRGYALEQRDAWRQDRAYQQSERQRSLRQRNAIDDILLDFDPLSEGGDQAPAPGESRARPDAQPEDRPESGRPDNGAIDRPETMPRDMEPPARPTRPETPRAPGRDSAPMRPGEAMAAEPQRGSRPRPRPDILEVTAQGSAPDSAFQTAQREVVSSGQTPANGYQSAPEAPPRPQPRPAAEPLPQPPRGNTPATNYVGQTPGPRFATEGDLLRNQQPGEIAGNPYFMPPEQQPSRRVVLPASERAPIEIDPPNAYRPPSGPQTVRPNDMDGRALRTLPPELVGQSPHLMPPEPAPREIAGSGQTPATGYQPVQPPTAFSDDLGAIRDRRDTGRVQRDILTALRRGEGDARSSMPVAGAIGGAVDYFTQPADVGRERAEERRLSRSAYDWYRSEEGYAALADPQAAAAARRDPIGFYQQRAGGQPAPRPAPSSGPTGQAAARAPADPAAAPPPAGRPAPMVQPASADGAPQVQTTVPDLGPRTQAVQEGSPEDRAGDRVAEVAQAPANANRSVLVGDEGARREAGRNMTEKWNREIAPRLVAELYRQGKVEEARQLQEFIETDQEQARMESLGRLIWSFSIGDVEGMMGEIDDVYNGIADGYTVLPRESRVQKNADGDIVGMRVAIKNDETGETFFRDFNNQEEIIEVFGRLASPAMAEYLNDLMGRAYDARANAPQPQQVDPMDMQSEIRQTAKLILEQQFGANHESVPQESIDMAFAQARRIVLGGVGAGSAQGAARMPDYVAPQ